MCKLAGGGGVKGVIKLTYRALILSFSLYEWGPIFTLTAQLIN